MFEKIKTETLEKFVEVAINLADACGRFVKMTTIALVCVGLFGGGVSYFGDKARNTINDRNNREYRNKIKKD